MMGENIARNMYSRLGIITCITLGFSYRASFIYVIIRITNRCDFLYYVFISFFSRLFPTFFGPSWAHHQGYFKLLFLCYHLVHAVLCSSSACVSGLVCGGDFGVLVDTSTPKSPPQTSPLTHADDQQSTA